MNYFRKQMPEHFSPLNDLHILGIRYLGTKFVAEDQLALATYKNNEVYELSGARVTYVEPRAPDHTFEESDAERQGALCGVIAGDVAEGRASGKAILMTGGNCNHAPGVLGGLQLAHGSDARIGLVWLDAHGDFNTPHTTITGSLGGMPVAVCAGLAFPEWREKAGISAPIPIDRILMSDVRNLDAEEEHLMRSAGVKWTSMKDADPKNSWAQLVDDLSKRVDMIYLHVDADILDGSYVPHHATGELDGPSLSQVASAMDTVFATAKVIAFAIVSVYFAGRSDEVDVQAGEGLVGAGLKSWRKYGTLGK